MALAAVIGFAAAAVALVVAPPPPAVAGPGFDPQFPRVGVINYTDCKPTCATGKPLSLDTVPSRYFVDPDRRELYGFQPTDLGTFPRGVVTIDMDRMVQSGWIDLSGNKLPSDRFSAATYDPVHHRLVVGEQTPHLGCGYGGVPGLPTCGNPSRIAVIDLSDPKATPVIFQMPIVPRVIIGAQPPPDSAVADGLAALSIDPARNRLYALTTSGSSFELTGSDPRPVAVVAYDAANFGADSVPLWTYRIRSCGNAVVQKNGAAYFDVTEDGNILYWACRGVSGTTLPHGVVRLHLHPGSTADPTEKFDAEFVAFGGDLNKGFTTGDPVNDRLGIGLASASGQRLYVYDARHDAWVSSALLGSANVGGAGTDPGSGRFYVLSEFEGVRSLDAAALPAVLGRMITLNHAPGNTKDPVIDPLTRRFFLYGPQFIRAGSGEIHPNAHMWVYEDRTLPYAPPPAEDPDSQTRDIDEALALQVSHTGFGSAYGARVLWVGGISSVPIAGGLNDDLSSEFESFKISPGDRGLFLSEVARAELSGESDRGEAAGEAVAARLDDSTADDLEAKYGQITTPLDIGGEDAPPCNRARPGKECLTYREVTGSVGQLRESRCNDFGGDEDPTDNAQPGSSVQCRRLDKVSASASAAAAQPTSASTVTVGVAESRSNVEVVKLPDGGVRSVSTSVARGITVSAVGVGRLAIGELSSVATTQASGRPGTASSTLDSTAKNVRIQDAQGATVFSCGVPGVDSKSNEEGEQCEPLEVARAINRHLAPHVTAHAPPRHDDEKITGSPGGAQAIVTKDPYAYWNDVNVNGDSRREVPALELTTYHDTNEPSRMKLMFAAVYAESQYKIGDKREPVVTEPTKLSIVLVDDEGSPLSGGAFQVRRASDDPALPGELVATCRTAGDGIGDCAFDDVTPGDYVVTQLAAPPGYARAEDGEVQVEEGWHTVVEVTNYRAIGSIAIGLASEEGSPLAGGTFELLADNGDQVRSPGDRSVGTCSTDLDGRCSFDDVPLAAYIVDHTGAPPGYLLADDAAFELSQPGQHADLVFIVGLEGIAGSSSEETAPPSTDVARVEEPTETTQVDLRSPERAPQIVVSTRPLAPKTIVQRLRDLPRDVAQFLRREPGQAVLFALVWLLLGSPLYLASRRRSLSLAKVSI